MSPPRPPAPPAAPRRAGPPGLRAGVRAAGRGRRSNIPIVPGMRGPDSQGAPAARFNLPCHPPG
eukprot:11197859-Lingulodinium_polyedra.AAC.1